MDTNRTLEKTNSQLITYSNQRGALYNKYKSKIIHNPCLGRTLVSFQANKEAQFSWFKYREGFSEKLVTYLIETLKPKPGALLDPFSGIGTSLFTTSDLNWQTIGIELLPVGVFSIEAKINARTVDVEALIPFLYEDAHYYS
ncbi:MAG: DNA methyltransferase [Calothrix sp. FI2-JRJ7]|jgi:tRNA/tmRNA/rRNA uracil-C5-methylase (TrmA/RlmC/RlmD family)|nr:DNA methyltransferase [Calothrix sp. FI2-JRJ7]